MNSRLQTLLLWPLAIIVIACGIYLTKMHFLQTEWLSRAGCVVVMLGVWSGLGVVLQEKLLATKLKWQRRNSITATRARMVENDDDDETIRLRLEDINDGFDKRYEAMRQQMKFSLGVLEVSLLMTGTFLWGFGDLLIY